MVFPLEVLFLVTYVANKTLLIVICFADYTTFHLFQRKPWNSNSFSIFEQCMPLIFTSAFSFSVVDTMTVD